MRVFNEKRGYFPDVFWIAELEERLEEKGLYQKFKDAIAEISGEPWEEVRTRYSFEQDVIIEALDRCLFQSKESSERMFESDGQNYILTPEKFAQKVKTYCEARGRDHQVVFLIDEIGQYIGDNSQLMLNLQTVAEELGTILKTDASPDLKAFPKITGLDISGVQAGEAIECRDETQTMALCGLLEFLVAHKRISSVASIDMGDTGNIKLRLRSGYDVMLGKAEDLETKFLWVDAMLPELAQRSLESGTLDVTGTKSATYTRRCCRTWA